MGTESSISFQTNFIDNQPTMKLLLFVVLTLPALAYSQVVETIAAVGLAAAGAGLAGLILGAALPRPRHHRPRYYRPRKYYHYHGKREANEDAETTVDEVMNTILGDINDKHIEGCFQRLLCDITANPNGFKDNIAIKDAVMMSEELTLAPEAKMVSKKLLKAVQFGQKLTKAGFGVNDCEAVFNQCPFSGQVMDEIITQYRSFSEKY